jgi:hypothetical protein
MLFSNPLLWALLHYTAPVVIGLIFAAAAAAQSGRGRLIALGISIALGACLTASFVFPPVRVYLVENQQVKALYLIGSTSFTFSDGSVKFIPDHAESEALVINNEAKEVRLEEIIYTDDRTSGSKPKSYGINPYTFYYTNFDIDFVGPDDKPSASVRVKGKSTTRALVTKWWLTWIDR